MLQSEGVGLMVWSPLAGGLLSGKYGRDGSAEAGSRRAAFDFPPVDRDRAYDSIDVLKTVADARGVSVAQVALAWLLHQQVVTSVIIGAKRVDQLDDNLAATGIKLTQDELAALDNTAFSKALSAAFGDRLGRLSSQAPRHVFPLSLAARRAQVQGRVAAIGNAAQTLHPVAGQGLNLGLRDAARLAQTLAGWLARPEASPTAL
ncbi:hypothetical protein G6F57_020331 [Rhizopus arrhizus]|nr:hypothetical protein G6F57_020331 [Rhizopus arrhizus]